jgi:uncharacterized protein YceK
MKNKLTLILTLVMSGCSTLSETTVNNDNASYSENSINTWYAGTEHTGTLIIQGLRWTCSGGTCVLKGPYGDGLNMNVCQELSTIVGGLRYYYNSAGMQWTELKNKPLLDQCNLYNER